MFTINKNYSVTTYLYCFTCYHPPKDFYPVVVVLPRSITLFHFQFLATLNFSISIVIVLFYCFCALWFQILPLSISPSSCCVYDICFSFSCTVIIFLFVNCLLSGLAFIFLFTHFNNSVYGWNYGLYCIYWYCLSLTVLL